MHGPNNIRFKRQVRWHGAQTFLVEVRRSAPRSVWHIAGRGTLGARKFMNVDLRPSTSRRFQVSTTLRSEQHTAMFALHELLPDGTPELMLQKAFLIEAQRGLDADIEFEMPLASYMTTMVVNNRVVLDQAVDVTDLEKDVAPLLIELK